MNPSSPSTSSITGSMLDASRNRSSSVLTRFTERNTYASGSAVRHASINHKSGSGLGRNPILFCQSSLVSYSSPPSVTRANGRAATALARNSMPRNNHGTALEYASMSVSVSLIVGVYRVQASGLVTNWDNDAIFTPSNTASSRFAIRIYTNSP